MSSEESTKPHPRLSVNLKPGDSATDLIGSITLLLQTKSAGAELVDMVGFRYDDRGILVGIDFFTRTSPKLLQQTQLSTDARPQSTEGSPVPVGKPPRRLTDKRIAHFITTLPRPKNSRRDTLIRWSRTSLDEWLPAATARREKHLRNKSLAALTRAGITTVAQLKSMRVSELLAIPQIGEAKVTYLATQLAFHGLSFAPEQ